MSAPVLVGVDLDDRDAGVIALGSRGYGPLRSVLLGGVSGHLTQSCACPLLILPRGSSVTLASEPAAVSASEEVRS